MEDSAMSRSYVLKRGFIFCMPFVLVGCGIFDDDDDGLHNLNVTIEASENVLSLTEHVGLTVSVKNDGPSRVVWGNGSSSCQLGVVVRIGEINLIAPGDRDCTDDLSEQGLDPGKSRSETWIWDGRVLGDDGLESLPAGEYDVYGTAGLRRSGEPVVIRVIQQ
jgi:hypothetical protein